MARANILRIRPIIAASIAALGAALAVVTPHAGSAPGTPLRAAGPAAKPNARIEHWAFKPLRSVPLPKAKNGKWARSPVDVFILAALEEKGLKPTLPADRRKLIRRVYFDVVGLPPKPEEVDAFVADPDPEAYEKLVDRLLASPHYGERWGRHWLDLARYADSDGQESDRNRPTAYHYRDFVIRALNDDLPFNTFVRWQLAGDEYEPDNPSAVAATGFLVAGTHANLDSVPMEEEKIRERYNEMDDILSTTGVAFLGMTLACARCHDHKYDPIPTRDYYRLMTAFNSTSRAEAPLLPRAEVAKRREAQRQWKEQLDAVRKELTDWLSAQKKPLEKTVRNGKIDKLAIGPDQKALLRDNPNDAKSKELAKKFEKELAIRDGDYRPLLSEEQRARWDALAAAVKSVEGRQPAAIPTAYAIADVGAEPRENWLLDRGDFHRKKEAVQLGFLTALTRNRPASAYWADAKRSGVRDDTTFQRRAIAEWITDTQDGAGALLARVIVNRLWQGHFGEGLVRTPNDFGKRGEAPTHPALLEWLASELVRDGWKLKPIHRVILLSAAYQQDTTSNARSAKIDPENRLLWRRKPLRIESEIFRDSMLAVAGSLNLQPYGPAFKAPVQREAILARNVKDPYPEDLKDSPETRRRTVYMFHKRVVPYPLSQAFDGPDASTSCGRRNVTTVAPQALAVLNEPFVRLRAGEFARRLQAEAGNDPAAQIQRAYRLALGRAPTAKELSSSVRFVTARAAARAARGEGADASMLALTDFAQAVFGLNEFMYVD